MKSITIERSVIAWTRHWGLSLLRFSLGVIFVWFGLLKLVDMSPATNLVTMMFPFWFIPILGIWEILIGVCFFYKPWLRAGIFLMLTQMAGTFLPLLLLPDIVYGPVIGTLTLEGQYIVKNIVFIAAAIVVGSQIHAKS